MNIAIAGSSGYVGRATADRLLERIAPSSLVLVTRSPDQLADYARRGVSVRLGDFDRPDTLPGAFAGVDRLLLISASDIGRRIPQHVAAIEAARSAGVGHVAYTSYVNPTEANPAVVSVEHRATEEALRASGLAWTMLRDAEYADLQLGALQGAIASGVYVHNRGQLGTPFVTRDDVAAVAAAILTTAGHEGRAYDVTGPDLLTGADLAAIAAEVGGTAVRAIEVDDAAFAAGLVEHAALPAAVAAAYATFGRSVREGHAGEPTTVVADLTGRPATRLRDLLARSLPATVA
jgi:NAD(P)H dehydrogenase (quinone)